MYLCIIMKKQLTKKSKTDLIESKLKEPIKVGDRVDCSIPYIKKTTEGKGKKAKTIEIPSVSYHSGIVKEIINHPKHGIVYDIETFSTSIPYDIELPSEDFNKSTNKLFKAEWVRQNTDDCGANPFKPEVRIDFMAQDISQLLMRSGYGRRSDNFNTPEYNTCSNNPSDRGLQGCTYGGANFNPYITDAYGLKVYYQRPFVWTLEQKQLLIHSIYNGIEIGKFIFRDKSWKEVETQMKETGHGFNYDCVDGKQRIHAILEFVQNKFADEHGNYWKDLSEHSQRHFLGYRNLAIGQLREDSKDSDVIATFLTLNFTGTPMSKEHITFVQSIKL